MSTLDKVGVREITKENPYKLVFVCLGNICRSPTAEGIFRDLIKKRGIESYFVVDSAGTSGYHNDAKADPRSCETAEKHGIELITLSRKFEVSDLDYFDLIIPMDHKNYSDIRYLATSPTQIHKVVLIRKFDAEVVASHYDVPDPYYGGERGFEEVFLMLERSCINLLDELVVHIKKE